ncbi:hypothetical protein BH23CHL7_BH23CHL7_19320 [soil metagenome]
MARVMPRRSQQSRRTDAQVAADERSAEASQKLGRMLADARGAGHTTQRRASTVAGLSQTEWSALEHGANATLQTWNRAAMAVGSSLNVYLKEASAADRPRDAVHLRNQELLIRTAHPGRWQALAEELIDRDARTSRAADVLLRRRNTRPVAHEYALGEIWDWFSDVGGSARDWQRRLDAVERFAIARMVDETLPRTSGVWIVCATARNRRLVGEHANFFRSRFPGSGHAWLAALTTPDVSMPNQPALIWVSVGGDRLWPARLGSGRATG